MRAARRVARAIGLDIVRYRDHLPSYRQASLLNSVEVDLVVDVGANTGQYAEGLRRAGYAGRILSLEPLAAEFRKLTELTAHDPRWDALNLALGPTDGCGILNVSRNSVSSSLRDMLARHVEAAPDSRYIGQQVVEISTLDAILNQYRADAKYIFVKIDVQGAERDVLAGCQRELASLIGVQLELSLAPLYEGSMLMAEALRYMEERDFFMVEVQPGFRHPVTGHLLQCDGLFFRRSCLLAGAK